MLSDGNGWRRMLAQRLLVEGKRVDAEKSLRAEVKNAPMPLGGSLFRNAPLHSLWTLYGLGLLNAEDLQGNSHHHQPGRSHEYQQRTNQTGRREWHDHNQWWSQLNWGQCERDR
jgi:hypothetical protein